MVRNQEHLKRRLGRVRRRWRLTAALRGLLLVLTEALGTFLVILLADLIYDFSGRVLLVLWCLGGGVVAVFLARHVLYPMFRPISDDQVALLLEERSETVEGAAITAVEVSRRPLKGLSDLIGGFLVSDAVRRIDGTPLRAVSNLRRLRKHVVIALVLLGAFVGTTVSFPRLAGRGGGQRVLLPWARMEQEAEQARQQERAEQERLARLHAPIDFEVVPGDVRLLRGKSIRVTAKLSRTPAEPPQILCRPKSGGEWELLAMAEMPQALRTFARDLTDINEDMEYLIATAYHRSAKYSIQVYDPLRIKGIELTYHYPKYLELDPETRFGANGDISVPATTKVDLRVVANNPLKSGHIRFEEGKTLPLTPGPKAIDGAKTSFVVNADTTYRVRVSDIYGDTVDSDQFFFVKAVPDNPPTVEMVCPKVDMSVHPLCEVTFKAKVTDDFGVKDAVVRGKHYRGEKITPLEFPMKVTDSAGSTSNVKDGTAEYVLELESSKPQMQPGDMAFYHFEVSDRKGQQVKTDVFYVKLWPLEVAATWPNSVAPPDLPHETFNDPMDLMLFLAAAWNLEQQRGRIPEGEFNAKSEKIAQRMEVGDPPDFSTFWGHGGAPGGGGPNRDQILQVATKHVETAHGLLKHQHQPGDAADHMRVALAMVESLSGDKRMLALEMNPEPIHTGQPSSGHADDPVMEQIAIRLPSTVCDSITAFQQPDNPPRLLPPDYRRALRIKERKGFRIKQLRIAGEIYATEEQLIEMAREQLGHIQLREAIDDNTPNDPAVSSGSGGEEIRVDKRAIPYKKLISAEERRAQVARAEKKTLSEPKVEKVKTPLKYDRIPDNQRRGGPNPFLSQAPGSGGGEQDLEEQDQPRQLDEEALRRMRQRIMAKRPPTGGGGGGGGGDMPQPQQQAGQANQQASPQGGQPSSQEMGQWQGALSRATGQLARDVARTMQPGDQMAREAVEGLRAAAAEMHRASESFRRGEVRKGIQQARRGQQMLRSGMHRLQASQYDSLEQAIAAAYDGAAALVANQYRISQGTEQIATRVREMTGQTGQARPGQGEPGKGQPGQAQPGQAEPGKGQPGQAQPGKAQPGQAEPGKGRQPGQAQPGRAAPSGPSRQAVETAAARDPRIGPQLQGLAAEQGRAAQDLSAFVDYVSDLKKWAREAAKEKVAGSLDDVGETVRREGTAQKMVDAAVSLAARDLQSARSAQQEIERSLDVLVAGVQEAGEILAGSHTGVLRRAAREAKEIGTRVAALTSRSGEGQPGPSQPGQAQPGQAQPGQGQPGQSPPGQTAQSGQPQPGQAQPGQGQPGQGQPGQDQERPGAELAQRLAGQQAGQGEPSEQSRRGMAGGGVGTNRELDELMMKTQRLVGVLEKEQLAEQQTIQFIKRRSADANTFRKMFERARLAEAEKFSKVVLGVGKNLEEALQEALSEKRLHAELREECPPKYRDFVNAYFEALSKAAAGGNR